MDMLEPGAYIDEYNTGWRVFVFLVQPTRIGLV
jgi:hypothetical protein